MDGRPIQCTDDVGGSGASYQSGREMPVGDIATDAVRFQPPPAPAPAPAVSAAGDGKAAQVLDTYVIPGEGGRSIVATGVAQNLKPGVNFQIGHTNYMTVNQNRDGSSYVTTGPSRFIKNRLRITESTAPPEERHLQIISAGIAGDWQALGRQLRLSEATLDQLRMDFATQGQQEVNRQMLRKWLQTSYPATLNALAQALANMGRGDLADALA